MGEIKILGQTYNIIEKDMNSEEVIFGEIEYLTNTIIINKKNARRKKEDYITPWSFTCNF